MKKLLTSTLAGLALALATPAFSQDVTIPKVEFVDAEQVRPNYKKPHKKIEINRMDLEKRLHKFAKLGMDEDAWLYVEYKDGTSYAYEIGEDSKHFSVDVAVAHSEEMLFILSDENIKKVSVYHFHPGNKSEGVEYFPPSPSDVEFFISYSEYFKFDSSPKLDARVVDRNGVFTMQFTEDMGYPGDDLNTYEKYFLWYCVNTTNFEGFMKFINEYTQIILEFEEL